MRRTTLHISQNLARWIRTILVIVFCIQMMKMVVFITHKGCEKHVMPVNTNNDGLEIKIKLQEKFEIKQRNLFKTIFGNIVSDMRSRHKIVIYNSDKTSRDGAMSESGLLSAFLFSILSNRRFMINTTAECSSFCHYNQHELKWDLLSLHNYVGKGSAIFYDLQTEEHPYHSQDFYVKILQDFQIKKWRSILEDVLVVFGDFDIVDDALRHKDSFLKFPGILRSLFRADHYRLVHNGLFETDNGIRMSVNNQLVMQIHDTEKLVCFHSNQDYIHADMTALSLLKTYSKGYKFYMSDAGINTDAFREHSWKIIKMNFKDLRERQKCPKSFDSVAVGYILTLCHILVTTNDPVGLHAAHMRSNSVGLYCSNDDGVIYPCKRELISESFRDESKLPTKLK